MGEGYLTDLNCNLTLLDKKKSPHAAVITAACGR